MSLSGGCQCGAIRFRIEEGGLGRGSICLCRMCQKAFGGFFGPLVTAQNSHLSWTRGALAYFQSSNRVRRGFCRDCGTPLTYEMAEDSTEIAIGALDHPELAPPVAQLQVETRLSYFTVLHRLPEHELAEKSLDAIGDGLVSYQHPDHDTDAWPAGSR